MQIEKSQNYLSKLFFLIGISAKYQQSHRLHTVKQCVKVSPQCVSKRVSNVSQFVAFLAIFIRLKSLLLEPIISRYVIAVQVLFGFSTKYTQGTNIAAIVGSCKGGLSKISKLVALSINNTWKNLLNPKSENLGSMFRI